MEPSADSDDIEAMARDALAGLPPQFRGPAQSVLLRVEDWPRADMLRELEIEHPADLTGLYEGVPLTQKSLSDPDPFPDVIWLFREPILAEWRERGDVDLDHLVAHVLVHELAHHFGWSDDDIAAIDRWWE